ncbi:hypothetical protein [Sphingomonas sp. BAUL-RG-20F-R05-02]|uniref:hypothetical protein n=1 Tax=Sphingomonas sp. BAUL-RG-20F-R05-02 TaxID=2914830 RepID=UPI001F5A230B|nr:hypothetical protein [Sphingomonas sp. BAUL-RG-20F-R05-02]
MPLSHLPIDTSGLTPNILIAAARIMERLEEMRAGEYPRLSRLAVRVVDDDMEGAEIDFIFEIEPGPFHGDTA